MCIRDRFIDALILGVMVGITLWLFNIEYATTIACVIGLTGLIPLLGIYVGGVIGAVMLLTVSPMDALIYVIILEVLHQIRIDLESWTSMGDLWLHCVLPGNS